MSKETIAREAYAQLGAMSPYTSNSADEQTFALLMVASAVDRLTELLRPLAERALAEIAKEDAQRAAGR